MGKTTLFPAYEAEAKARSKMKKDSPLDCGYVAMETPTLEDCQNPCDILKNETSLRNTRLADKWLDISWESTPCKIEK